VRRLIISFVIIILLVSVAWFFIHQKIQKKLEQPVYEVKIDVEKKVHRLIVFVHGTFGSSLSLLDAPSVIRDDLKGSVYAKTARSMRKDQFFFSTQPLMGRGLVGFQPSFDRKKNGEFFAAYPIAKSFDLMCDSTIKKNESKHYYAFGWSGLLSQEKRRREALRFLNELSEEVHRFNAKGIQPKVTLLCHSHGGNLALNMGLLVAFLREEKVFDFAFLEQLKIKEKIIKMFESLPEKKDSAISLGQKKWDYKPAIPLWNIDELVLLGTPVQPETDFGILASFFESILHCYSFADKVQATDWISTSRYYSEQRFDHLEKALALESKNLPVSFKQLRIMIDREISDEGKFIFKVDKNKKRTLASLLIGNIYEEIDDVDPTHKELWFLVSPKKGDKSLLKPLPFLVCMPLIKDLFDSVNGGDFDLNVSCKGESFCLDFSEHNQGTVIGWKNIPLNLFESIKKQASSWETDAEFLSREESLIYSHLRAGREC
jgi:hypothetical protein